MWRQVDCYPGKTKDFNYSGALFKKFIITTNTSDKLSIIIPCSVITWVTKN